MAATQTLRELSNSVITHQSFCITFPEINNNINFELTYDVIHLLPSFHGYAGDDPYKHLKEFHLVCSSMKPAGVTDDQIKLRAFPFSLKDMAKDWLYYLSESITTWVQMEKLFLQRYFPASRVASIRKERGIMQMHTETLYEYWKRFTRLVASCPQHQISEQLLIQYFYEGLTIVDHNMIDAASGGVLFDKTPDVARRLIENMAMNLQQFDTRDVPVKSVNADNSHHRYESRPQYYPRQFVEPSSNSSLEEMMKTLTSNIIQFQQDTQLSIKNIEAQMRQLETAVSRLEAQNSGKHLGELEKPGHTLENNDKGEKIADQADTGSHSVQLSAAKNATVQLDTGPSSVEQPSATYTIFQADTGFPSVNFNLPSRLYVL